METTRWHFSHQTTWQWVHDISLETYLLMSFSNKFWMGKCGKLELEQGKDILM
jgi:hypothetical protein